jgi:hypothetical protein
MIVFLSEREDKIQMENFYSRLSPDKLMHMVCRASDVTEKRVTITDPAEFLQVAGLKLAAGDTFRPHKHIPIQKITTITQESWVVLRGAVVAYLFDLDDSLLAEVTLNAGDLSVTFHGGHTYKCAEDALVYEFKTGPYLGIEKDKVFLKSMSQ